MAHAHKKAHHAKAKHHMEKAAHHHEMAGKHLAKIGTDAEEVKMAKKAENHKEKKHR